MQGGNARGEANEGCNGGCNGGCHGGLALDWRNTRDAIMMRNRRSMRRMLYDTPPTSTLSTTCRGPGPAEPNEGGRAYGRHPHGFRGDTCGCPVSQLCL